MSKGQWIVIGLASFGFLSLLGYEIFALVTKRPETLTISRYVWDASYKHPLIPWAVGMFMGLLSGHFFWQR